MSEVDSHLEGKREQAISCFVCVCAMYIKTKTKKQKIRKQVGCHIRETIPGNLKSYGPRDMPSEE